MGPSLVARAAQQSRPPPERNPTMSDFTELAEKYIARWNETDPTARRALISEIWSENGRYIDPLAAVAGHDEIAAGAAAARAQFAGMTFRLASAVAAHTQQSRVA